MKTDIDNFGVRLGYEGIYDFSGYYNSDFHLPVAGFYYSIGSFQFNYGIDFGSVDEGISHIFSWRFAE